MSSPRPLRVRTFFIFKGGEKMSVLGFLGPEGTHSEEAAMYMNRVLGNHWTLKAYKSIYDTLLAVDKSKIDYCIVPVENSIEGSVRITLDTLARDVNLQIDMELVWQVHNYLLAKDKSVQITKLASHTQALAQCRNYIKINYPSAQLLEVSSTAHAAQMASTKAQEGIAAIASKRAAQTYGLIKLDENIQDNDNNVTRFILLSKKAIKLSTHKVKKAMLICQMDGSQAGSLCHVLEEFARFKINMTHIESRPTKRELGNYMFFFEVEIPKNEEERLQQALSAIENKCFWLKKMGEFAVISAGK